MKLVWEFIRKPAGIKFLLVRAMFWSLYYRYIIQKRPFASYSSEMGTFKYETPETEISDRRIEDVRWAVYAVRRWMPWSTKCFDRALTAKRLLNDYGLPCTLYMGVAPENGNGMEAHAWLRCGTEYVSGGNGAGYAVTGIYGDSSDKENIKNVG